MSQLDNPYVLALLAAAVLSVAIAYSAQRRGRSPGARSLVFLALSAALWQVGYAFELGAAEESNKLLWAKLQYPGIVGVPVAWLTLTVDYSGRGRWLTRRNVALLALFPVLTVLMTWTNEIHHLIWTDVAVNVSRSPSTLVLGHGLWFWAFTAYGYLFMVFGIGFLIDTLLHFPRLYREQSLALLLSALVPWVSNWTFVGVLTPGVHLDLTPFAFAVSCALLAWAIIWARFLDVAPAARETVFEHMDTGVMVLDSLDRIIDCNPAARRVVGMSENSPIGLLVSEVWPQGSAALLRSDNGSQPKETITVGDAPEERHYSVSVSPLFGPRGDIAGRLVVFDDSTQLLNAERERGARAAAIARAEELHLSRMRVVATSESLRSKIAQNLHGSVQNKLILMLRKVKELKESTSSDEMANELDSLFHSLQNLIDDDIRPISQQLYPSILRRGLVPALQSVGDRFKSVFAVEMELEPGLVKQELLDRNLIPERSRLAAYRIAEEALTNVVKHANASKVVVALEMGPESCLRISVRDDGQGFDTETESGGMGIGTMKDYAEVVGGQCNVRSAPGRGTEVRASLPQVGPGVHESSATLPWELNV